MLEQSFVGVEGVAEDHLVWGTSYGLHLLIVYNSLCEWGCYCPLFQVFTGEQYAPQVSKRLLMGPFLDGIFLV